MTTGAVKGAEHEPGAVRAFNPVSPSARALGGVTPANGVVFVDAGAPSGGDGASWQTAYTELQQAFADAVAEPGILEIRVAEGVYKPDSGTGFKGAAFLLRSGLAVMGGYPAGGGVRDPDAHATVLDGDLQDNDESGVVTDNAHNVVVANGTDPTAVLDGFTVRAGNTHVGGGGLYVILGSPTIRNTDFVSNTTTRSGGAVYLFEANDTRFDTCTFQNNTADLVGGAVYIEQSDVVFESCEFDLNAAGKPDEAGDPQGAGGAFYATRSSLAFTDSRFTANRALRSGGPEGGAISIQSNDAEADTLMLDGCEFLSNETLGQNGTSGEGGALYCDEVTPPRSPGASSGSTAPSSAAQSTSPRAL